MNRLRSSGYHVAMGLVSFLWIAPILWVIVISFRSFDDVAARSMSWPVQPISWPQNHSVFSG